MAVTVLYEGNPIVAHNAREEGEHLWLSSAELEAATGWTLKPEGLCKEEACVALPDDGTWTDTDGRVDLAAFARRFGRPVVRDDEHSIWAFGDSVGMRHRQAETLQAPDFALPDLDGRMHKLSDYRGRKIFLMSWGSY